MSEELDILWSLRDLDERRSELQAELARFPEQRRALDQRVAADQARLEALKGKLTELQKKRRERELEVEAVGAQERKFQSQLPAVRKNEEYTALLHEITAAKARRSDLETEVLMFLDEEESAQRERPAIEHSLQAAEREAAERRAQLDREERDDRERLAALDADRSARLERLPAATRARYERVHGSREGRAVVPILKGACGGCFRAQPPQMLQEARRRDRILTCDGCGRLLILPPENS